MRKIAKVGLNNFNKHTPNPSPRKKRDRQEGTIYHFTNMKHKRFLPLLVVLVPAISLGFLELFYFNPKLIYVVLILINLSIFFAVWQFTKAGNAGNNWWDFMILPGLMSAAAVSYSILLSSGLLIQIMFCFYIVLLYIYLRYVYYYLARPAAYTAFSIENISSYGNFLTFFLISAAIFGLKSFLNISVWILIIALLIASSLITYQIIWANAINIRKGAIFIFINSLILIELFWAAFFLPINHHVAGLSMAICYYILIGLVRHFLIEKLDAKKVKLYLGFGLTSLFIILITARWL